MRLLQTLYRLVLAVLLGAMVNSCAAPPPSPQDTTTTATPTPAATPPANPDQQSAGGKEKGKNCIWTCLQWGKECNVDPRGVYKCNRTCEQFGEQCE